MKLIATTYQGLENVLAKEITLLGGTKIKVLNRAVEYNGDLNLLYSSNYNLRTALRILKPLKSFYFKSPRDLYNNIYKLSWQEFFSSKYSIAVKVSGQTSIFKHSGYAALKAKDAIVDKFRFTKRIRPNVDKKNPQIIINLHFKNNKCDISLDSSGEPLFKRGYRKQTIQAPLSEVLAAGLILLSEWDKKMPFIDFMCGSGTIPIEAALIATNTPPQILRKNFSFFFWKNFDSNLWRKIVYSSKKNIISSNVKILASDKDPNAINITKKNILNLPLKKLNFNIFISDFRTLNLKDSEYFIITNPPYNLRLKTDIKKLYKELGDSLKKNFLPGSIAWIFTANLQALKYIGLQIKQRIVLYNGKNEARFIKIPLY